MESQPDDKYGMSVLANCSFPVICNNNNKKTFRWLNK